MQNKGLAALPIIAVFILVSVAAFLYNQASADNPNVQYVGETSELILKTVEDQALGFQYMDEKIRRATTSSIATHIRQHGFEDEQFIDNNCEEIVHPVITNNCTWEVDTSLNDIAEQNIQSQIQQNPYLKPRFLSVNTQVSADTQIKLRAQSSTTVPRNIQRSTKSQSQAGSQNLRGNLVDLRDIDRVECSVEGSCTGFDRLCAAKPAVYNQLKKLEPYLEKNDFTLRVTQSTRSWEIQNAFYEERQSCLAWKEQRCQGLTEEQCRSKRAEYIAQREQNNPGAQFCFKQGTCPLACNPGPNPNNPNNQCTHMTGNAIDVELIYNPPNGERMVINNQQELADNMRKTMCNYGFINLYDEVWHYEYKSQNWEDEYERGETCAYYTDNTDGEGPNSWSRIDPIHEEIGSIT